MDYSWKIYALTTVALFLKLLTNSIIQGYYRLKTKSFTMAEDAAFFAKSEPTKEDNRIAILVQKIFRNDLENIPIFLFLLIGYILLNSWAEGTAVYASLFVFSRIAHTIAYLKQAQPWRHLAYDLGIAVMFALSGHIVHSVLTSI